VINIVLELKIIFKIIILAVLYQNKTTFINLVFLSTNLQRNN